MFKGFEYNKNYRKICGKSIYAQEYELLHEFLTTENENIRFEYTAEREATNSRQCCAKYVKDNRMPLKVIQRKNYVFAIKTKES